MIGVRPGPLEAPEAGYESATVHYRLRRTRRDDRGGAGAWSVSAGQGTGTPALAGQCREGATAQRGGAGKQPTGQGDLASAELPGRLVGAGVASPGDGGSARKTAAVCRSVDGRVTPAHADLQLHLAAIRPSNRTVVFAFADDYSFGILQSAVHVAWFRERASRLNRSSPQADGPNVFDQVVVPSIMEFTCLRSHEPGLFHLVNAHVGVTAGGTTV
jgi:hypothetical protein